MARAVYHNEPYGIVSGVAGESVTVVGLGAATPHAVVVFSSGGLGMVGDMRTDGALQVAHLAGPLPALRDTAALEPAPLSIAVHAGLAGRIIDPLGAPLDDGPALRPPPPPSAATPHVPLFGGSVAGITERAPPGHAIDAGLKALNAAYPLIAGRTHLVTGERGVGKSTLLTEVMKGVARVNAEVAAASVAALVAPEAAVGDAATTGGDADRAVHIVYVSLGASPAALRSTLMDLRTAGALAGATVVAAPTGATPAMRYLAPFTGAAIAEAHMRAGRHALLVIDDLSDHFAAARMVSGVDWLRTEATPTYHAHLFDRAARLAPAAGGGSLTLLASAHSVPTGAAHSQVRCFVGRGGAAAVTCCPLHRQLSSPCR